YFQVLQQIRRMHAFDLTQLPSGMQLAEGYSEKLYRWEQNYFLENFVGAVCQLDLAPAFIRDLEQELDALTCRLQKLEPSLIHRDLQPGQTLTTLGVYRPSSRELRVNGIVWAGDYLELGDGADLPVTIRGQGVLMARSIRVRSGLVKATPDDLCVLVARDGPIRIDTESEIQAALVAVNDRRDGRIFTRRRFQLTGSLAVDRLCSSYDPITGQIELVPGPSDWNLRYDPIFRPRKPQLQVALAHWVLFERFEREP
ncbi:MAG TPA: hypothetical protein PKO06_02730, partial [Candidatus Ozemobacteraceae bacterium]|nr:hypothetical protein [Candidatus Ozemobacteraceae bacterium]